MNIILLGQIRTTMSVMVTYLWNVIRSYFIKHLNKVLILKWFSWVCGAAWTGF